MYNLDTEIRMSNMLKEQGIKTLQDFLERRAFLAENLAKAEEEVKLIEADIEEKTDFIKAVKNYWRLKPINKERNAIKNPKEKAVFEETHKADLSRFQTIVDIINHNKLPDGTLPKAEDLNTAIAEENKRLEKAKERVQKLRDEVYKYKVIEDNLRALDMDIPLEDNTKEIATEDKEI